MEYTLTTCPLFRGHLSLTGADAQFCMAINVTFFEDISKFKAPVDTVIRQIWASRYAAGIEHLYALGGPEAEIAAPSEIDELTLTRSPESLLPKWTLIRHLLRLPAHASGERSNEH